MQASYLPAWLLWIQALSIPFLAAVGALIAFQQMQIAKVKLQHDLYDRRIKIYSAVREMLGLVSTTGQVSMQDVANYWTATIQAEFLFPSSIRATIEEIGMEVVHLGATLNQIKRTEDQAKLESILEKEGRQSEALRMRLMSLREMFDPYLRIGPRLLVKDRLSRVLWKSTFLRWSAVIGLSLQLVGSVLVFFFGLPSRIPVNGLTLLAAPNEISLDAIRLDDWYGWIGLGGIVLIGAGTLAQLIPAISDARRRP